MGRNRWNAERYDDEQAFVYERGADLVELLDPKPRERVLDLGCGTGHLTAEIAERVGPEGLAIGIDNSTEMIDAAHAEHDRPTFERADATEFEPDEPVDAVFSNAALHWIDDQDAVAERIANALVPGGRFVAELGGAGNVDAIVSAAIAELRERGHEVEPPWYFPAVGEYASLLEGHGFEVRYARHFDRPTDLDGPDGLRNWLDAFGDALFAPLDDREREAVVAAVEDRLRAALYDPDAESWTADYRRLRVLGVTPAE